MGLINGSPAVATVSLVGIVIAECLSMILNASVIQALAALASVESEPRRYLTQLHD